MLIEHLFLTELDWRERSPVAQALAQHASQRRFVHFSPINKIGVNASTRPGEKSVHKDPAGVYFYSVDWVMRTEKESVRAGHQYGFDRPYWFVADIDWSTPGGVILSKMTWDDVRAIATRNGWLESFQRFMKRPLVERKRMLPRYVQWEMPGSVFWHYCDAMNKVVSSDVGETPSIPKVRWSQSLRGVAFIYDDNTSTIHSNEPHQLLAIDPRTYRIVDSGINRHALGPHRNTPSGHRPFKDSGAWEYWEAAVKKIMGRISERYGGKITYKKMDSNHTHKQPVATFTKGDRQFVTSFHFGWGEPRITVEYRYERAEGWRDIKGVSDIDIEGIMERVDEIVDEIMRLKTDMLFEPRMVPNAAMRLVSAQVLTSTPDTWRTMISNDYDPPYYELTSTRKWSVIGLDLETTSHTTVSARDISFSVNFFINGKNAFLSTNTNSFEGKVDPHRQQEIDEAFVRMRARFNQSLVLRTDSVAPGSTTIGWKFQPKVPAEMFAAFKGWLVLNCGFKIGGQLSSFYANEIAAYRSYEDKEELHSTITYVIKEYLR